MIPTTSGATRKGIAVLGLVLLCFIPTLFVMGIVEDRKEYNDKVRSDMSREWGGSQEFLGPVLSIPYIGTQVIDGKTTEVERALYVFPKTSDVAVSLSPSERVRGIFRIPVYVAEVSGTATFEVPSGTTLTQFGRAHQLGTAMIGFPMTDVRSISPESSVSIDGVPLPLLQGAGVSWGDGSSEKLGTFFEAGVSHGGLSTQGVHVETNALGKKTLTVMFAMTVNGNEKISIAPVGFASTIRTESSWSAPSFTGAYLPATSEITNNGFQAEWKVSGLGRSFPEIASSDRFSSTDLRASLITVALWDGIDQYDLVNRAVKYAILFIGLTFMGFFLVETLKRLRVHPIQYTLVGAALALFYLLLLSLSEQIVFGTAYLIAAGLTILLIGWYSFSVLKAGKHAVLVSFLLALLYSYLYFVLVSEDYALLGGTILLFAVLACTMYITRKVDWYGLDGKQEG
jgi:inner membrane protein